MVALFSLFAVACGSGEEAETIEPAGSEDAATTAGPVADDPTPTTAASTTGDVTTTNSDDGPDAPAVGEAGFFSVSGEEFAVTLLNRCVPFQDDEGNVDLQALAQGSGVKLNLYLVGESVEVSVDGSGLQDSYGSIAFGKDPVVHESVLDGDRWTGSATVGDSLGSGDTVDITWDVMIPAEANDCSL